MSNTGTCHLCGKTTKVERIMQENEDGQLLSVVIKRTCDLTPTIETPNPKCLLEGKHE